LLWLAVAFPLTSSALTQAAPAPGAARVVVVGPPREVRETLAELGSSRRHQVVAVCVTRRTHTPFGDIPSYVGLDRAARAIAQHAAEAILVLPGRHVSPVALRRLQWEVAGTGAGLYLGTGLLDVAPNRTSVVSSSGLDVLHVAPATLTGPRRALKDVAERTLALIGVVALLPVLLGLAVLVRRDSPGPALFRQQRVGKDGRPFDMLKFRSMTVTAESDRTGLVASNEVDGGVLFKIQQDPRVTSVGRWMRRYSLDELPQLWNVVRGEMSLVGPRPALPGEVARYDLDPRRRLVVKPGLTGLWQVSGRSDLSWEQSVRLDLRYVDNWSLRLDLQILVRTVRAVLGHRGAY
jgi:exopolysaccharide biosynthesis polyprenyl glycosylphosphotransferase